MNDLLDNIIVYAVLALLALTAFGTVVIATGVLK